MRGSSIERRLEMAEAKAGTSGGFFNPRSAAQNAIAARYWEAVIHQGFNKVPKKLKKEYSAIPRLQCAGDTNKVVYERIAAGILGRREEGKSEKDIRSAVIHDREQAKKTPVKTELRPMENAQNPPRTIRVRTLT